jgi:hypothetical protein
MAVVSTGCGNATEPCGVFTFNGSPNGNRGENISNSFAFVPIRPPREQTSHELHELKEWTTSGPRMGYFIHKSKIQFRWLELH